VFFDAQLAAVAECCPAASSWAVAPALPYRAIADSLRSAFPPMDWLMPIFLPGPPAQPCHFGPPGRWLCKRCGVFSARIQPLHRGTIVFFSRSSVKEAANGLPVVVRIVCRGCETRHHRCFLGPPGQNRCKLSAKTIAFDENDVGLVSPSLMAFVMATSVF